MRDIVVDETYKEYERLSRYQSVPYYFNINDNKYQYGTTKWLDNETTYMLHFVKQNDTLDSIALQYYNNPTYFWIIADFNRILDPFAPLEEGQSVKVPVFSNVYFKDN